jgi:Chitobiase/beta-hexosaminidase C-terminal domain
MPVISNLVFTKTDSTIVATWDTDTSSDSNLTVGGNPAPDNGLAANKTIGHQCIMPNLLPNTLYSCTVTSGGTSSSPQNVTTNLAQTRTVVTSATMGSISFNANASISGDTFHNCVASDGFTYMACDDGNGLVLNSAASGNTQMAKLTDESQMTGTRISLSDYGAFNSTNGTDGPGDTPMTNKSTGVFALNGHLFNFVYRQYPPSYSTNRYANWIRSDNNGATWNNFTAPSTFTANGTPVTPNDPTEPIQFYSNLIGKVCPILYAADDGTLGYNTAGNQIDGANAYVYMTYHIDNTPLYLMRMLRILFDAQSTTGFEYWKGGSTPAVADFVNSAKWSSNPADASKISTALAAGAWMQVAFVPGINSYIMTTWVGAGAPNSAFSFYSAPTPAGPWNQFFYRLNTGTGLHFYGPFPFHRDFIGNVLTDNIPVRIVFNGEPNQPYYRPNWATLTMSTAVLPVANLFVQGDADTAGQAAGNIISKAFPNPVTAGDFMVIAWRRSTTGTVTGVDDNMGVGNVWSVVFDTSISGATFGYAWAFAKATGPCTVTVHLSTSLSNSLCGIASWSRPTTLRGTTTMRLQSGTNALASNALAGVVAGDLEIGIFCTTSAATAAIATGSGWTGRETVTTSSGANKWILIADNLNATAGSNTATASFSGSLTGAGSTIAAFFTNTFLISGATGVAGTVINYSGAAIGSVTADGSGNYSIPGLFPGTYLLTPSHDGYIFDPGSQSTTILLSDVTAVNFTPTQIQVQTPTISPSGGTFNHVEIVTLSNGDSGIAGFAMYYTTDGSTPTTSSTPYTAPISVAVSQTIKALAVATSYANSAVASATFVINATVPSGEIRVTLVDDTSYTLTIPAGMTAATFAQQVNRFGFWTSDGLTWYPVSRIKSLVF